jgi:protein-S-isoprenylcysteine O-methyltransferase Ste14
MHPDVLHYMREEFSDEYARYSQRVRRLIPFIL